jgi:hypothetical protein
MADVGVAGDELVIRLSGRDRVLAFHRHDVRIPLASIRRAVAVDHAKSAVPHIRAPGTGIPGALALGTFYAWRGRGPKTFALVYGNKPGVVIDVDGGNYGRIVLTVADPQELLSQLPS